MGRACILLHRSAAPKHPKKDILSGCTQTETVCVLFVCAPRKQKRKTGLPVSKGITACISDRIFNQAHETKTLIHEFGHLLGAPDHYGDAYAGAPTLQEVIDKYGSGFSDDCIYGANKEDFGEGVYTICEGCRNQILAHLTGGTK